MLFLPISILFGVLHWIFVWREDRKGILISKPVMMGSLILWEVVYGYLGGRLTSPAAWPMIWFLIGLCLCTLGDMFLMFREKHFLKGLIAFLLGHVFYVVGFKTLIPLGAPLAYALIFALLVFGTGGFIYKKLYEGMLKNNKAKMKIPVAFYTLVISAMLYSSIMTYPLWSSHFSLVIIAGALLFFVSDVINAWAEFVGPIKRHRFLIMTTYYLAELFIAYAALNYFMSL